MGRIRLVAWCVGIVGAAACGPTSKPAAPTTPARPAPTLAEMVDTLCACKDATCADKVHADYGAIERAADGDPTPHVVALRTYAMTCDETARDYEDVTTLDAMRDAMCKCKTVACTDEVQAHYAGWMKKMDQKYRGKKRPSDRLMESGMAMGKCMTAARQADSQGGGLGVERGDLPEENARVENPVDGKTGVPECDAYLQAFDRYMQCDKVPQQARDASEDSIAQMRQAWAMLRDPKVPPEAKKAAADACKEAHEALKQSASAMGCPL